MSNLLKLCGTSIAAVALSSQIVIAQDAPLPLEVVMENLSVRDGIKAIYIGGGDQHFVLNCSVGAAGCITPKKNKKYRFIDEHTSWIRPGAKAPLTLKFIQDLTTIYNAGSSAGLVAEDPAEEDVLGSYVLDPTQGGYERDILYNDGPIYYGANLNDDDRKRVWKNFSAQILQLARQQKGEAAFESMLAKRCVPGESFCSLSLSAEMSGIGGIKEPRPVGLFIAVDPGDVTIQLSRVVCTTPKAGTTICRDWDTGKLETREFEDAP